MIFAISDLTNLIIDKIFFKFSLNEEQKSKLIKLFVSCIDFATTENSKHLEFKTHIIVKDDESIIILSILMDFLNDNGYDTQLITRSVAEHNEINNETYNVIN